jgi:predicted nicotinamide N-methyase
MIPMLINLSIEFAKVVLADILYPTDDAVFNAERLKNVAVLELGSGTGVLGVLLAPYVGSYVLTDVPELVPLMEKNISYNFPEHPFGISAPATVARSSPGSPPKSRKLKGKPPVARTKTGRAVNIATQPLDWTEIASTPAGSSARARACSHMRRPARKVGITSSTVETQTRFDLILAVDTLYSTALVAPFLAVLDEFASNLTPEGGEGLPPTLVIVVCELRDEVVLRGFLESWLNPSDWEIWRVGDTGADREADGDGSDGITGRAFMQGPYVVWAGWKAIKDNRPQSWT